MSNYKNVIPIDKMANPCTITIKPCAVPYDREDYAEETSQRLLRSATALPENGFLCWKIATEKGGDCHSMV